MKNIKGSKFQFNKPPFNSKNYNIIIENGIIPYNKIKDKKNINFVIATKDMELLQKSLKAIKSFKDEHKEIEDITVIISSSYEKLHELTKGAL